MEMEEVETEARLIGKIPADTLLVLIRFLVGSGGRRSGRRRWAVAKLRVACLAHMLGMEDVGGITQTALAAELGVIKATLNHHYSTIVAALGEAQARGGKSRVSREVYARRQADVAVRRRQAAVETASCRGQKTPADSAARAPYF